ncbi:hypothetical protein JST97_28290 [bacterium]|nr:hypothetical protein [bacterium]
MNENSSPSLEYQRTLASFQRARSEYRQLREEFLRFKAGPMQRDENKLEELHQSLTEALSAIRLTHEQLSKVLKHDPRAWELYQQSLQLEREQYRLESRLKDLKSEASNKAPTQESSSRQSMDLLAARIMLQESRRQSLQAEWEIHQRRNQEWETIELIRQLGPLEFQNRCRLELERCGQFLESDPSTEERHHSELRDQVEAVQKRISEKVHQLEEQREATSDLLKGSGFDGEV